MKLKTVLMGAAGVLALGVGTASAQMANDMTVVSWGGAYQASQNNAYVIPYQANTGISVVWEEA